MRFLLLGFHSNIWIVNMPTITKAYQFLCCQCYSHNSAVIQLNLIKLYSAVSREYNLKRSAQFEEFEISIIVLVDFNMLPDNFHNLSKSGTFTKQNFHNLQNRSRTLTFRSNSIVILLVSCRYSERSYLYGIFVCCQPHYRHLQRYFDI